MRGDYGMENVATARFITAIDGVFIAGSSTRNQRIERMRRDVNEKVMSKYKEIFINWETHYDMDVDVPENICFLLLLIMIFLTFKKIIIIIQ